MDILRKLKTFRPNSSKGVKYVEITLDIAEKFPHLLKQLGDIYSDPLSIENVDYFGPHNKESDELANLFMQYRSDKSFNGYHLYYARVLNDLGRHNELNILEIGIGTQNKNISSHMGPHFKPGASLRAFRDYAYNSQIFGADIDRDIMFSEDRIRTHYVDQLNFDTYAKMNEAFGNPSYDLIIDDGLHAITANLNSILFGLEVIKVGGWIVIEDIIYHEVCWHTVNRLIPDDSYEKYFLKCPHCKVFLMKRIK